LLGQIKIHRNWYFMKINAGGSGPSVWISRLDKKGYANVCAEQPGIGMRVYMGTYNLQSLKSDKIGIALVREVKAELETKAKIERKPLSQPASG